MKYFSAYILVVFLILSISFQYTHANEKSSTDDEPKIMENCSRDYQKCGGNSICTGVGSICGANSKCIATHSRCGDNSVCSGSATICGMNSICSGNSAWCGPGSKCTNPNSRCN